MIGTGSFEQCLKKASSLLNKNTPCPDSPCLFNGVHVPPIDFSVSHFIGVSEYWYSSEHVFGLGGPYDFVQYERAASKFCSRAWSGIVKEHEESRQKGRLGGDGEVEKGGRVVETGKWGDKVELSRLEMQCFKAAWIVNVLHEGIGMPRIVDPGGNATTDGDEVAQQAQSKGLGRPTFQSLDTVGDIAISWTLGKMVLEASKEVPLVSKSDKPLVDPLEDVPESPDFPIHPIRPPFLEVVEHRITPHLPSSLTRATLGFSPVFLLFAFAIFALAAMTCRLRHYLRAGCRRVLRGALKRGRDLDPEGYFMEEGKAMNGGPRPLSPWRLFKPLQKIFTTPTRPRPAPLVIPNHNSTWAPSRVSITRSNSMPQYEPHAATSSAQFTPSRPASPVTPFMETEDFNMSNSVSSLSSITRSRNSSQLNLSSLVPRQGALSRVNSTLLAPGSTAPRND